jgi:hypothetical protein
MEDFLPLAGFFGLFGFFLESLVQLREATPTPRWAAWAEPSLGRDRRHQLHVLQALSLALAWPVTHL